MFTVTTAASVTALTTLAAVKTELGITDTSEDDYLTTQIDRVSSAICNYLNVSSAEDGTRNLGRETLVETIRFPHNTVWGPQHNYVEREYIILARWPVASIVSVTEDGTALTTDEYELSGSRGMLARLTTDDYKRKWFANKVVVTYTAGWLLPGETGRTLPYEIEQASIVMVKAARFNKVRDPALRSENILESLYSYTLFAPSDNPSGIPAEVAAILEPYRNMSV